MTLSPRTPAVRHSSNIMISSSSVNAVDGIAVQHRCIDPYKVAHLSALLRNVRLLFTLQRRSAGWRLDLFCWLFSHA
jgi:hypothetical protein